MFAQLEKSNLKSVRLLHMSLGLLVTQVKPLPITELNARREILDLISKHSMLRFAALI